MWSGLPDLKLWRVSALSERSPVFRCSGRACLFGAAVCDVLSKW